MSSLPFAVTHRLESSHAWICGATGSTGGDLLIHHGAEWLQAMQVVVPHACSKNFKCSGLLTRCAAGFEPVEGRDARFNQPTTQPTCLRNPRLVNQKEETTAYTISPRGRGRESAASRVMSSTMSASDLKMAARMYRVIGHPCCNLKSGGHIRDGTSWLPKILPKICRGGKTLW